MHNAYEKNITLRNKLLAIINCGALLFFIATAPASAQAEFYKWVDEAGTVHFSDRLPDNYGQTKPPSAKKQTIRGGISVVKTNSSLQNRVELYSTSWCSYCKKARNFFKMNNVRYSEYDIEKNPAAALRKKRLDPRRGVPFVVINDTKIHGYIESAYIKALNLK